MSASSLSISSRSLSLWASSHPATGNTKEAVKRIEDALDRKSTVLDLSHLRLNHLPNCIVDMRQLEVLHLEGNDLCELPKKLGHLSRLAALYLDYNGKLCDLPKSLCKNLTLRCITTGGTGLTEEGSKNARRVFEVVTENCKVIETYRKITIDPNQLLYSQRPREVQEKIDATHHQLMTHGKKWMYNGSIGFYSLLNFRDTDVIAQCIRRAPFDKTDLYFMDLGSGYHTWVDCVYAFLRSHYRDDPRNFHVIGVTGEGEPYDHQFKNGNITTHKINGFKLENLLEEFPKFNLDLVSSVEFVVTSWTLRHLVDPLGTLEQAYHLLSPCGMLFGTGFRGYCDSEGKYSLAETLASAFGSYSYIVKGTSSGIQEQFALLRPDDAVSTYHAKMRFEYNRFPSIIDLDGRSDCFANCFAALNRTKRHPSYISEFGGGFYGSNTTVLQWLIGSGRKTFHYNGLRFNEPLFGRADCSLTYLKRYLEDSESLCYTL